MGEATLPPKVSYYPSRPLLGAAQKIAQGTPKLYLCISKLWRDKISTVLTTKKGVIT